MHRGFISLLIIAYFSFSLIWLWAKAPAELRPNDSLTKSLISTLSPFACLAGLEQYWALFSPESRSENLYNLALITFHNGLLKLVEFPRMEKLNLIEKLQKEKYRKLFNDNMPTSNCAFVRPDIARFTARAHNEPGNSPDRVAIFLISNVVPPPDGVSAGKSFDKVSEQAHVEKIFVYGVSPDDL